MAAVRAGIRDVNAAFRAGQSGAAVDENTMFQSVRQSTTESDRAMSLPAPVDRYVPETMVPQPATSVAQPNWQAPSFEALWGRPIVGTSGPTIGSQIVIMLSPGGETRATLDDLATNFPEVDSHLSGNVHPRKGYVNGFVRPFVRSAASIRAGILHVINWAPNYGLWSVHRDDVTLANGEELDRGGRLAGMTTPSRISHIRELLDGYTNEAEGNLVVRIFQTAPVSERRGMYRQIEGHDWSGDFKHGLFTRDDDIWDSLTHAQLNRLRPIINASR